ncbi:MAG TPA: chaperonin GroEL [Anaerolineae bacterium]|nr:chaperonin GroEL [Anaerolineae bacterium]
MPVPDVMLGNQAREGMLRGFETMARLLGITLGPVGRNIVSARMVGNEAELLTDAATIARRIIQLPERAEDVGAMLLRHMAWRAREEVGDGSATTAVLAWAIAREAHRVIAAGAHPLMVKQGIDKATKAATEALGEMSIPLQGEESIAAVASASTGNREIGKLLGEMYDLLGPNANIVIEPYIATYHDRAYREGARFRGGYVSPFLITDSERRIAVLDDVYVVVADMRFDSTGSVANILEQVARAGGKSVLFICKMMSDKAIGVLVANNERDTVRSTAISPKPVGDLRRGTLENIAILVGARSLTDKSGMASEDITMNDIGRAARVIVTRDHHTIIGGKGDKKAVRERLKKLRQRLRDTHDPTEREDLRKQVRHFSAGVGELRIGALTSQERKALTETAEEMIKAVMAGADSGIVPGGGAAYVACCPAVEALEAEGDQAIGVNILARALEEPMRRIAENAGAYPPLVIAEARRAGPGYGFDARNKRIVNVLDEGIVDPTMVAKRALELAASGSSMLLTIEALILHRKPEESLSP